MEKRLEVWRQKRKDKHPDDTVPVPKWLNRAIHKNSSSIVRARTKKRRQKCRARDRRAKMVRNHEWGCGGLHYVDASTVEAPAGPEDPGFYKVWAYRNYMTYDQHRDERAPIPITILDKWRLDYHCERIKLLQGHA